MKNLVPRFLICPRPLETNRGDLKSEKIVCHLSRTNAIPAHNHKHHITLCAPSLFAPALTPFLAPPSRLVSLTIIRGHFTRQTSREPPSYCWLCSGCVQITLLMTSLLLTSATQIILTRLCREEQQQSHSPLFPSQLADPSAIDSSRLARTSVSYVKICVSYVGYNSFVSKSSNQKPRISSSFFFFFLFF